MNNETIKNGREKVLDEARICVCGHRKDDYGSPEDSFGVIAKFWNTYLAGKPGRGDPDIDAKDVAVMMGLLKVARIATGTGTHDSFVDLAGYAACGGEIAEAMQTAQEAGTELFVGTANASVEIGCAGAESDSRIRSIDEVIKTALREDTAKTTMPEPKDCVNEKAFQRAFRELEATLHYIMTPSPDTILGIIRKKGSAMEIFKMLKEVAPVVSAEEASKQHIGAIVTDGESLYIPYAYPEVAHALRNVLESIALPDTEFAYEEKDNIQKTIQVRIELSHKAKLNQAYLALVWALSPPADTCGAMRRAISKTTSVVESGITNLPPIKEFMRLLPNIQCAPRDTITAGYTTDNEKIFFPNQTIAKATADWLAALGTTDVVTAPFNYEGIDLWAIYCNTPKEEPISEKDKAIKNLEELLQPISTPKPETIVTVVSQHNNALKCFQELMEVVPNGRAFETGSEITTDGERIFVPWQHLKVAEALHEVLGLMQRGPEEMVCMNKNNVAKEVTVRVVSMPDDKDKHVRISKGWCI